MKKALLFGDIYFFNKLVKQKWHCQAENTALEQNLKSLHKKYNCG